MAFILADRVKETTVTSGTGSVTLGAGFGAFQTFADGVGDGNETYYAIENDVRWEVGIGTYTVATNSLARDTVLRSSNAGSKIDLDGVSIVFATYPADKAVAFGITNYLPDGMPLTLGRTGAGNFIHAYVDNDSDETVALHMQNSSTPTWKFGLKNTPNSKTAAPSYGYVYGSNGKAGLYGASDAYAFVDSNLGFYVSHESANLLTITKDEGSVFTNSSSNVTGLTVKAAAAQSYPIQVWANSAGSTLSAVRENGYFAINQSSASYPLDVNGTANVTTLRFDDGTSQATASRSTADFASLSGIVNTKASQTELNAVSGLIESDTDTTYTAGHGLVLDGTSFNATALLTNIEASGYITTDTNTTYTAGHGLVLDGTSFNATALLTNIEGSGFSTSDTTYTAGSGLELSGTTFHASGSQGTSILSDGETGGVKFLREDGDGTSSWQTVAGTVGGSLSTSGIVLLSNTIDNNSGVAATPSGVKTKINEVLTNIEASGFSTTDTTYTAGHGLALVGTKFNATALLTNIEASGFVTTDTNTTYTAGNGLILNGTTFNASGASLSHSGVIKTSNTVDSNSGVAITPYAIKAVLTNIEASGFVTTDSDTTYTAGTGLTLDGTTFHASGASLSHSGVIRTSNTINTDSGVALTPYAVNAAAYAPLASPNLTGSPIAPTQSASDNSTKIATTAYADTAVSNLVDSSPAALNTLNELAAAINDDASFSTTITNSIAAKQDTITSGSGLVFSGSTLNASGATTSIIGITQLTNTINSDQDKALTPKAVNDAGYSTTDTTYSAGSGLALSGTTFNASGASLSHSGVIRTSNTVDSNSGVAITPYAVKAVLTNIEASGFVTTDTNTTYTAGNGLQLDGTVFNSSGASLSHSGVIKTSNTVDTNSGVAITPYAVYNMLRDIQGSGLITASSTETLTNKTIGATQLDGTINSARLPDLAVSDFGAAAMQTGGEDFADSDTVLMTAAAVYNQIEAHSGTLNTAINTKQNTVTAGSGLVFSGATLNASGASLSHSGVIRTANIIDSNSGVAATPYAITQWAGSGLPGIDGSLISTLTEVTSADADMVMIWDATDSALKRVDAGEFRGGGGTTYTAGNGLLLDGTVFNASGASLSHSGVIKTSNTVDSNSGVAITPYAIKAVLNNIEGSGFIQADSADTLTNKSIVATQLTGTINSDRLPDLAVSDFAGAAIQTGSESFADSDTALMTAGAVYNQIEAHSGTLNTAINTKQNTVTAGSGLIFSGATLNASGASLSHSGVIRTSNTVDSNSGVAITPYAVYNMMRDIQGSGLITASSEETLTNKTIGATQLTGTIASARLPDLAVSDFAGAAIQTGSESFADSETALMTAAAVYNQIEAHSGTLNTAIGTKHDSFTAGSGLVFSGSTLNASGATTAISGVTLLTNTIADDATKALTPKAVNDAGYITASSTNTLTNKTLTSPDINTPDIDGGTLDGATIGVTSHTTGKFTTVDATTDFTIGGTVITDNTITDDGTLIIAASTATSFSDGNITNVGDINCDSISVDDAAVGLNIAFGGNTTLNKITLTDNLASALDITEGSNSYMKFVTTDPSSNNAEKIVLGKSLVGATHTDGSGQDASLSIDCSKGNYQEILLGNADVTSVVFTNASAGQRIVVRFKNHSTAKDLGASAGWNSVTINGSSATLHWPGGTEPTLTDSNNAIDVYGFVFTSTVTTAYGFIMGQDIKA